MTTPRGGWNRAAPAGAVRCTCRARRADWAMLHPDATRGCCALPCCTAARSVITATREEIRQLRAQCAAGAWRCARCGEPVLAHERNFECLDAPTRASRALRLERAWPAEAR